MTTPLEGFKNLKCPNCGKTLHYHPARSPDAIPQHRAQRIMEVFDGLDEQSFSIAIKAANDAVTDRICAVLERHNISPEQIKTIRNEMSSVQ